MPISETGGTHPPDIDPRIGTVLGDTYRIVERIGEGGMASIYRATHARIDREFAVKILQIKAAQHPEVLARFEREAKIGSQLGHDHIVEVIDFNHTARGEPYLVMDLLRGMDLAGVLQGSGRVPVEWAMAVIRQVCSALSAAHEHGVVHRDLKPENIFLCGEPHLQVRAKVMDFGLAKVLTAQSGLTNPAAIFGTPWYMSPEQAIGRAQESDQRTDIYAVGVILYLLLGGRLPFEGKSLTEVVTRILHETPIPLAELQPGLPPGLAPVVARAMHRQPEGRFGSAGELMAELQAALGSRWRLVLAWGQPAEERLVPVSWAGPAPAAMATSPTMAVTPSGPTLSERVEVSRSDPTGPVRRSAPSQHPPVRRRTLLWLVPLLLVLLVGTAVGVVALLRALDRGPRGKAAPPDAGPTKVAVVPAKAPDAARGAVAATRPSAAGRAVTIESEPAGASVEVNGKSEGVTPARLSLPQTDLSITLKKAGHAPLRRQVAAGTQVETIRVVLKPLPATLTVTALHRGKELAADLFLDGRKVDQTTAVLRGLKAGRHTVRIQAKGFQPVETPVMLKPGDNKRLPMELRR
jgi:serine/threonine protein kinase